MTTKGMLIFRDITYAILIILIWLPANPLVIPIIGKALITIAAVGLRVWQHVNYYKQTGKIY
jgi:hypothetical protein